MEGIRDIIVNAGIRDIIVPYNYVSYPSIYNMSNNILYVPDFYEMGTRLTKRVVNGVQTEFKTHCWNQWRVNEAREDKLHLADSWRVKMGQDVVKYFQEERRKNGPLV